MTASFETESSTLNRPNGTQAFTRSPCLFSPKSSIPKRPAKLYLLARLSTHVRDFKVGARGTDSLHFAAVSMHKGKNLAADISLPHQT